MNNYLIIILIIILLLCSNKKISTFKNYNKIVKKKKYINAFPYKSKKTIQIYKNNNISIKENYLLDNGNNKKLYFNRNHVFYYENNESIKITSDKGLTSKILKLNNIPVPNFTTFEIKKNNLKFLKKLINKNKISYPLVLKPLDGHQGKGITLDIKNFKQLKKEIIKLSKLKIIKNNKKVNTNTCIIEEFKKGDSFRIFMVKDEIINIYCKEKPYVIGDGKHNVNQLIKIFNKNKIKDNQIQKIDKNLVLSQTSFKSIIPKNKKIILHHITSMHNGSNSYNIDLKKVHPDNIKMFKKIHKKIDVTICGIDYITNDITKSWKDGNGFINEINYGPGFKGEMELNKNKINELFTKIIKTLKKHKSLWI